MTQQEKRDKFFEFMQLVEKSRVTYHEMKEQDYFSLDLKLCIKSWYLLDQIPTTEK